MSQKLDEDQLADLWVDAQTYAREEALMRPEWDKADEREFAEGWYESKMKELTVGSDT